MPINHQSINIGSENTCKQILVRPLFLRRHSSVSRVRSLPARCRVSVASQPRRKKMSSIHVLHSSIIHILQPITFDTPRGIVLVKISSWAHWHSLLSVPAPPKKSILAEICCEARHAHSHLLLSHRHLKDEIHHCRRHCSSGHPHGSRGVWTWIHVKSSIPGKRAGGERRSKEAEAHSYWGMPWNR